MKQGTEYIKMKEGYKFHAFRREKVIRKSYVEKQREYSACFKLQPLIDMNSFSSLFIINKQVCSLLKEKKQLLE